MTGFVGFFELAGVYVRARVGGGVGARCVFAFGLDAAGAEGLGEGGFGFWEGL